MYTLHNTTVVSFICIPSPVMMVLFSGITVTVHPYLPALQMFKELIVITLVCMLVLIIAKSVALNSSGPFHCVVTITGTSTVGLNVTLQFRLMFVTLLLGRNVGLP